jgi:alpha-amylase/alpha-mannosidase (GH57 family)
MATVALAFLWHQHQPYYPDDVAGENLMPWVRLHGIKDYWGMATHLLEFPEMRCTINLVPSLLIQLQAYTDRGATDRFLQLSRIPADGLSEDDRLFLLDHFFMANPDQMIRPHSRYFELYLRRGPGRCKASEALRRFKDADFRDLQTWFNLTWIHPIAVERDEGLRALVEKGRGFTEQEKNWLLDQQLALLRAIVPLHHQLAERGQVELTTTPLYHPILPLLLDKKLARETMPEVKLPRYTGGYSEDAEEHVRRAVAEHERVWGVRPKGMWPAEGSVCQAMTPLLARYGIRWIATDEEILGASTQGFVGRDSRGHVRNPDHLYRPYRVTQDGHELNIVFRDHALSDMIGFHYQRSEAVAAAEDFLAHLRAIGQAVTDEPVLVPVILDGENCWEHYPEGGVPFLRALYERCCRSSDIKPVRLGEFLEEHPPRNDLPRLVAGSWIHHNFAIWIGHEEDNAAWDLLHRTRDFLRERCEQWKAQPGADREELDREEVSLPAEYRRAWEEIYIAEGSDWFWWYGDDHSSTQDALFDYLFRKHLQNVYLLLGETPPAELAKPISRAGPHAMYSQPRSFLDVVIDGRRTFLQWLGAGRYTCHNERGTMAMVASGPLRDVYFGFDPKRLLVRIDLDGPARQALAEFETFRVGFVEPPECELVVDLRASFDPDRPTVARGDSPQVSLRRGGNVVTSAAIEVGIDQVVELAIPFACLEVRQDQPIHFFVELLEGRQSRDRAPREGTINLTCPSPHFEQIMWDV